MPEERQNQNRTAIVYFGPSQQDYQTLSEIRALDSFAGFSEFLSSIANYATAIMR